MKHSIEVLNENFEVVKVHKTTFSSLRKALARIYDLQLKGNVRVMREDGHSYDVIVYSNGVFAESEVTGQRYSY